MVPPDAVACPQGTHAGTCGEEFWKELLGGKEKKSKEQNLKELGF
jgi:hypothetical protein